MDVDELKVKDLKELHRLLLGSTSAHPYDVGTNYFIRTVTMIQIGKLVKVTDQELVLENAVWVPDTGRFTQAVMKGELSEVELFPKGETIVGRGTVVDACKWNFPLPSMQR